MAVIGNLSPARTRRKTGVCAPGREGGTRRFLPDHAQECDGDILFPPLFCHQKGKRGGQAKGA
ncbi:hypothetical protein LMG27198_09050 [Methylocystis echinoides]|uniref:Uncharacterized protein n=1 Tax=Methylocystis echinoides TaxID=29468 RepID=A0A9W6LQW9_9HYPH|nr:hypothetical protein LMG27198_09050 [Methylocystis echinoides]